MLPTFSIKVLSLAAGNRPLVNGAEQLWSGGVFCSPVIWSQALECLCLDMNVLVPATPS
jgi:hypothetical protein